MKSVKDYAGEENPTPLAKMTSHSPEGEKSSAPTEDATKQAVYSWIGERNVTFKELMRLRAYVKSNEIVFKNPGVSRESLVRAHEEYAHDTEENTQAFSDLPQESSRILTLVLDSPPGGQIQFLKQNFKQYELYASAKPFDEGGFQFTVDYRGAHIARFNPTMLAREYDLDPSMVSSDNQFKNFLARSQNPWPTKSFDIILCNHGVARRGDKANPRPDEEVENDLLRMHAAHIMFSLLHVKEGGTVILLLKKIEAWDTIQILYAFSQFSELSTFKSTDIYAAVAPFVLVAKRVRPGSRAARDLYKKQKWLWLSVTAPEALNALVPISRKEPSIEEVLKSFGNEYLKLGRQPWEAQLKGVREAIVAAGLKIPKAGDDTSEDLAV